MHVTPFVVEPVDILGAKGTLYNVNLCLVGPEAEAGANRQDLDTSPPRLQLVA